MSQDVFVIGVDYGSDSVRSVILNARNGAEISSSVFEYPRWKQGLYCNATENRFRQHPLDYVEGLETTIMDCVKTAGAEVAKNIKGISIDTTGSTPVAVDASGTPLALLPEFAENPNAMFVLWKDHSALLEAEEINLHAQKFETNYLQFVGGIYSSEWFWAKLLHVFREDERVRKATASWVEHCDWIPFLLTGGNDVKEIRRGVCAAGHKGLWSAEFGGFPPNDFFAQLDPLLDGFTSKLPHTTFTADKAAGTISKEWSLKLGLPENVVIGIGAFDAHMGAVGGQIEPYYLSKVMGTSTCDMLVAPVEEMKDNLVRGICGQVPGSVIPGMIGLEAGQSAFGDIYAWFKKLIGWPLQFLENETLRSDIESELINKLSQAAEKLPLLHTDELAVDWLNGRRTPDANQALQGAILGLDLGSDAPSVFKALVEASCFGARAIVDRFVSEGVPVKGLIGLGGVARKSPYIMQVMANVMDMPIKIHRSHQTCASGAAMFAATASGIYDCVEAAMAAMGQGFDRVYHPQKEKVDYYAHRMKKYKAFGQFISG